MVFPEYRPRRMRRNAALRSLIRETRLAASQFIYPLFIVPGKKVRQEVVSMPGVFRVSVDQLGSEAKALLELGVNCVILFGIPEDKDPVGSGAHAKDGIVQRAIRELKNKAPDMVVITDVCLCAYTSHGHCGVLRDGKLLEEATPDELRAGPSHAYTRSLVHAFPKVDAKEGVDTTEVDGLLRA